MTLGSDGVIDENAVLRAQPPVRVAILEWLLHQFTITINIQLSLELGFRWRRYKA